jgi:competence protein ComEC
VTFELPVSKINADIIVISKTPSISIRNLSMVFNCRQWIFDSSNSSRKVNEWKNECEQLGLPYHAVVDKGAFVMNMD